MKPPTIRTQNSSNMPQNSLLLPHYRHIYSHVYRDSHIYGHILGNHRSVLHCSIFVFLRLSYKWNHTIYNLFRLSLLLEIMPLRFIHFVEYISTSLCFIAEEHFMMWMYHSVFNQSFVKRRLGCFQFLAITNKGAVSINIHMFM